MEGIKRIPFFLSMTEVLIIMIFVSYTAFVQISRPIIFSNMFYFSALSSGLIFCLNYEDCILPVITLMSVILTIGVSSTVCHQSIHTDVQKLCNGTLELTQTLDRIIINETTSSITWFQFQGGIFCFISAWNSLIFIILCFLLKKYWDPSLVNFAQFKAFKDKDPVSVIITIFLFLMTIFIIPGELLVSLLSLINRVPIFSDIESPNYLSIVLTVYMINKIMCGKPLLKRHSMKKIKNKKDNKNKIVQEIKSNFRKNIETFILILIRIYSLIISTFCIATMTQNGNENGVSLFTINAKENLYSAFGVNLGGYYYNEQPSGYYITWFISLTIASYVFFLFSLIFSYSIFIMSLIQLFI